MDDLTYPVLLFSGPMVEVFRTADALRAVIGVSTDKGIKAGFYERAWFCDSHAMLTPTVSAR